MKRKRENLAAEDDSEVTLVEPRFNEEAKEAARPVVPLSRVTSADLYAGVPTGGPRLMAGHGRNSWPRGLLIMLAVVVVAAVVTIAAIYRSAGTNAPAAAPQTVNQTTVETEPEAADSAPEPALVEREPEAAPSPATTARENGTAAPAQPERAAEPRAEVAAAAREEPVKKVGKDDERRARDEEKWVERSRKEEKKLAEREEKEAERLTEKPRDQGKREETRPRLVGIYTERRKP